MKNPVLLGKKQFLIFIAKKLVSFKNFKNIKRVNKKLKYLKHSNKVKSLRYHNCQWPSGKGLGLCLKR